MTKDYDDDVRALEGVTREFTLRGIHFVCKPVMPGEHLSNLADAATGANATRLWFTYSEAIRATLLEEYREAWDELLQREMEIPISLNTMMQISDDLVQDATGRPPTQPSPSGSRGENGSTRSTDASGSTAAPVLPPSTPARAST